MCKCIIIVGRSCSGKDSIMEFILEYMKKFGKDVYRLQNATTREMRSGEVNGREYTFLNKDTFDYYIRNKTIFEYRSYQFYDKDTGIKKVVRYGTMKPEEKHDYYITIGGQYTNIKNYIEVFGKNNIQIIHTLAEEEELVKRAFTREQNMGKPNYKEMYKRLYHDYCDFVDYEEAYTDCMQSYKDLIQKTVEVFAYNKFSTLMVCVGKMVFHYNINDVCIPVRLIMSHNHYKKIMDL